MPAPTPDRLAEFTAALADQRSLDYVRFVSCLVENDGAPELAVKLFDMRWPKAPNLSLVHKAAVSAGTVTDANWGGPLAPIDPLASAFLAFSRPLTLLGKIPGLRRVPFNVGVPMMTAPTTAGWVGEGQPKPISKGALTTVTLQIAKVADTIIETAELVKLMAPDSDIALRADLAAAIAVFLDAQFVDPAVAGVTGVSPPSVTNGLTPIAPSGTTDAALVADVGKLIATFSAANPGTASAVLLMMPGTAAQLAGASKSQTLLVNGGTYGGYPVVVSGSVGARIVMLDAGAILYADGGVEIGVSRQTSVQMDSAPDMPATAATVEVSLWQYNLVAIRAERFVNWKRARASAVQLVSPIAYVPGT